MAGDFGSFMKYLLNSSDKTVEDICDLLGISRATYYRYVKEPVRFSEADLVLLSEYLNLPQNARKQLYSYCGRQFPEALSARTVPNEEDMLLIERILNADSFLASSHDKELEYYGETVSHFTPRMAAETILASAGTLSGAALSKARKYVTFTIFRCFNLDSDLSSVPPRTGDTVILAHLIEELDGLIRRDAGPSSGHISVVHYIPQEYLLTNDISVKLRLFKEMLPIQAVSGDYMYIPENAANPVWSGSGDICLIRYRIVPSPETDGQETEIIRDFLIRLPHNGTGYMTEIGTGGNHHLYQFFLTDVDNLKIVNRYRNILRENKIAQKCYSQERHIILFYDLCFDSFDPRHWLDLIGRLSPATRSFLKAAMDPDGQLSSLSDESFLMENVKYFIDRYNANEMHGSISIIHEKGLRSFVAHRMISDLYVPELSEIRFTPEETAQILNEVLDRLGAPKAGEKTRQQFYIIRDSCPVVSGKLFSTDSGI